MDTPRAIQKVLMTADTVGGVWTFALELARGLARRGVQVELATLGALPSTAQRAEARAVPGLRLHASTFKLEWMDDPWDDVDRSGAWLLELERRLRPDVVHLNGYSHGQLAFRAPVLVVGHSCVLSWWEAVHRAPAPPHTNRYRDAVRAGLHAAAQVVAPSHAMRAALERHYGPLPHAQVILNGRDPSGFAPGPKVPLVLSAGRLWDPAKNVALLAAAAPQLPCPVVVAGDATRPGGEAAPLQNVRALGMVSPQVLAGWMARASVYALPARYEPFGLSVLEAALSGCALVLGDIASLRELWDGCARFVSPDDPAGLVRALRALLDDDAERARLAEAARARALRLDAQRTADAYLAVYDALRARGALRQEA